MRIAVVAGHYWPSVGGVERVAKTLVNLYRREGHEVRVLAKRFDERLMGPLDFAFREPAAPAALGGAGEDIRPLRLSRRERARLLPLVATPMAGRVAGRCFARASGRLYTKVAGPTIGAELSGAQIVHVFGTGLLTLAAVRTARRADMPVVITPFAHPAPPVTDETLRQVCAVADAVCATTPRDADGYLASGVAPERLHVLGVPVPAAAPAGDVASELPPAAPPLVLCLGARRPAKGWDLVLDAAEGVWERIADVRFAFVGPGPRLRASDPRILDVGRVSDPERARWLQSASVLCLPSRWESFGISVAESWSVGVPVVVSRAPVLRGLVEASGGGLAVPRNASELAHALLRLLEHPEEARRLGARGRRYWEHYCDPERVGRAHLELYAALAAGS